MGEQVVSLGKAAGAEEQLRPAGLRRRVLVEDAASAKVIDFDSVDDDSQLGHPSGRRVMPAFCGMLGTEGVSRVRLPRWDVKGSSVVLYPRVARSTCISLRVNPYKSTGITLSMTVIVATSTQHVIRVR